MKCYYLFLDDVRLPKEAYEYKNTSLYIKQEWTIARSYNDFVRIVSERYANGFIPCVLSLDHDLVPEHYFQGALSGFTKFDESYVSVPTGWHCLKWFLLFLRENDLKIPLILIHSKNKAGAENMMALIDKYYKDINGEWQVG